MFNPEPETETSFMRVKNGENVGRGGSSASSWDWVWVREMEESVFPSPDPGFEPEREGTTREEKVSEGWWRMFEEEAAWVVMRGFEGLRGGGGGMEVMFVGGGGEVCGDFDNGGERRGGS